MSGIHMSSWLHLACVTSLARVGTGFCFGKPTRVACCLPKRIWIIWEINFIQHSACTHACILHITVCVFLFWIFYFVFHSAFSVSCRCRCPAFPRQCGQRLCVPQCELAFSWRLPVRPWRRGGNIHGPHSCTWPSRCRGPADHQMDTQRPGSCGGWLCRGWTAHLAASAAAHWLV